MNLETLTREAQALSISHQASMQFKALKGALLEALNTHMTSLPHMATLIGGNPRSLMLDNHRNHLDFMEMVFRFNAHGMLCQTIPWVYRTYRARGFSFDYFPIELKGWKKVIERHMEPDLSPDILAVYDFMIRHHEHWIELSTRPMPVPESFPEYRPERQAFRAHLLAADYPACVRLAEGFLKKEKGQALLYMALIQPVMYELGRLWEQDEISTAEEHLATSMVSRLLASLYGNFNPGAPSKGKAVVSCAPNEFHELGARMLADLLEGEGWDVLFLGANTPGDQLIRFLKIHQPTFLALSLTLPFGLHDLATHIAQIKEDPGLQNIKILVGGLAFSHEPELWKTVGADACASSPATALSIVQGWQREPA